ncbi:MAG TPA: glycosyl hydrolase family 18 protein [Syntrophomonadaceae bacterium]|nr:glycosyl hydrolase family 18 protein [Syntrophomonadaceae bacterium]
MDYIKKYPYIVAAAILLLIPAVFIAFRGKEPAKKPVPQTKKLQVMAFYEKGWNKFTWGFPSLTKHYRDISILMPYWYTLKNDGSLGVASVGFEPDVITFLKKHPDVKLQPLINKDTSSQQVLTDQATRTAAIENIYKTVMDNNFSGVNIDFELLPPENRDDLTVFVRDLAKRLHQANKMVSVSVMPKLDGLEDLGAAYDYGALGQLADYITIMTYDKHNASTVPGSVSPYDWVEKNIQEALKYVSPDKLVVCIGAYGYDWPVPKNAEIQYISMKEALQRAQDHKAAIQWDDATQSAFFNYWVDSAKYQVWFENGFSVTRKVALAKKYGLRGVAIWRMGFEDEQYWTKLREAVNK